SGPLAAARPEPLPATTIARRNRPDPLSCGKLRRMPTCDDWRRRRTITRYPAEDDDALLTGRPRAICDSHRGSFRRLDFRRRAKLARRRRGRRVGEALGEL